jgi:hemoglobin-like flavoprotein
MIDPFTIWAFVERGIAMMTREEIQSIRNSFRLLDGKTEVVAILFYNRLFRLDPSLRMLFRGDLTEQGKKLMDAILVLNVSLDRFPTMRPTLQHLGKRYAKYGVRPQDYDTIASALLQTMAEFVGPRFNQALERIWTKLLSLVRGEILQGATEAETAETVALTVKA